VAKKRRRTNKLTDKQKLFCLHFISCYNATKAYQRAYGCTYESAKVEGSKHLTKPNIKAEIRQLKQNMSSDLYVDARDLLQKYIDIAFADIKDFVTFGTKEVRQGDDLVKVNYVEVKDSNQVDGTMIQEVKQTKEGISIKLHDKLKAMEQLGKYLDMFADKHQRLMAEESLALAKKKYVLDKRLVELREREAIKNGW
jgi:phage terminase small subunit